jgi:5-methylcytosine-specific restriction endonuclease McrA
MNRVDPEFIQRAQEMYKDVDNRAHHNQLQKKYFNSVKGYFSKSKGEFKKRSRIKNACQELTSEQRLEIGEFYKNTPFDCEVDHIIPISKGGKHEISNLQYLGISHNRSKGNKIIIQTIQ